VRAAASAGCGGLFDADYSSGCEEAVLWRWRAQRVNKGCEKAPAHTHAVRGRGTAPLLAPACVRRPANWSASARCTLPAGHAYTHASLATVPPEGASAAPGAGQGSPRKAPCMHVGSHRWLLKWQVKAIVRQRARAADDSHAWRLHRGKWAPQSLVVGWGDGSGSLQVMIIWCAPA
jgi:hypothetical protein